MLGWGRERGRGGEVRFPVLWQAEVRGEGKEEEKASKYNQLLGFFSDFIVIVYQM